MNIWSVKRTFKPVWFSFFTPIMDTEDDGEGAGRQQLLVVVVIQAMGCRQGKSVANLFESEYHSTIQKV